MSVVVFGSINIDLVAKTSVMPKDGQTVIGDEFFTNPGGKGANQAVASARMGAPTEMVGRVGNDIFADELLENLKTNSVGIDNIFIDKNTSSGTAIIIVDASGQNRIVVIPAANGRIDESDIDRLESALKSASILLLQLELPIEAVIEAAEIAKRKNVKVIFDPAPAQALPERFYPLIDIITPNQTEAELLTGIAVTNEQQASESAEELIKRGVSEVIIKMGSEGVFRTDGKEKLYLPAFKVKAIDTVAAGDAFNGCLAAMLNEGASIRQAIEWAQAAAALSVTRQGAQQSMPTRQEVESTFKLNSERK